MPASDFSSSDPDFSQKQEEQCARIIDGLRQINTKIVRLGGSLDALTSTADRIEALLESLDEVTQARAMESYRFEFDLDHPNNVIPFNPATGEFNPIAPKLKMALAGKKLVAHCEFSNCYESAPDTVQGGMVAAVYDQVLAYSVMVEGSTGPTIWMRVSYLKPTPINEPLRFECAVDSIDGRKFSVKGSCHHGDEKVSEAEGLILGAYDIPQAGGGGG
jgi:acyl-coenzyme A thioesterase PaaI-like protein